MNKSDIAGRVAGRAGVGRSTALEAVDAVFEAVAEALTRGDDVRIAGFVTFGTRSRPARTGRNQRTGESLKIAASTAPTFKAGKPLNPVVVDKWILGTAPASDPRTHGCSSVSTLVTESGGFEQRKEPHRPVFIRCKPTGRKAAGRASASR